MHKKESASGAGDKTNNKSSASGEGTSDADLFVKALQDRNYECQTASINATKYGSAATRQRFLAASCYTGQETALNFHDRSVDDVLRTFVKYLTLCERRAEDCSKFLLPDNHPAVEAYYQHKKAQAAQRGRRDEAYDTKKARAECQTKALLGKTFRLRRRSKLQNGSMSYPNASKTHSRFRWLPSRTLASLGMQPTRSGGHGFLQVC